jgi:hypothetical protein
MVVFIFEVANAKSMLEHKVRCGSIHLIEFDGLPHV